MRQDPMAQGLKKRCPIHYEALEQNVGYIFTRRVFFFSSRYSGVPYFFSSSGYYYYYLCRLYICSFSPISIIRRMLCAHTHTHTHTRTHTDSEEIKKRNLTFRVNPIPTTSGFQPESDPTAHSIWFSFLKNDIPPFLFSFDSRQDATNSSRIKSRLLGLHEAAETTGENREKD
jgi:hypothetical protein